MNRKKTNTKNIKIFFIILIIIMTSAILTYTLKNKKELNVVEKIIKDCIVEVQTIVSYPIKGINNFFADFNSLKNVLKENKILKSNVEKIESLETENIELKQEINKLKEELNIKTVLSDYEYLNDDQFHKVICLIDDLIYEDDMKGI